MILTLRRSLATNGTTSWSRRACSTSHVKNTGSAASSAPSEGARYRTYTRLKAWAAHAERQMPLFDLPSLRRALDDIYKYPLRSVATDALNRHLRSGMDDHELASLVIGLRDEDRLSIREDSEPEPQVPRIICSVGLFGREHAS